MNQPEPHTHVVRIDDVIFWIEQGESICLKAVSGTDPVELTRSQALHIAAELKRVAELIKD